MFLSNGLIRHQIDNSLWMVHREDELLSCDDLVFGDLGIDVTLGGTIQRISEYPMKPFGNESAFEMGAVDPYDNKSFKAERLDCSAGIRLRPGHLYLASIKESFECLNPVIVKKFWFFKESIYFHPVIDGRSTLARLGLPIHQTCGVVAYGFNRSITLEICPILPIILYKDMRIATVRFSAICGEPDPYNGSYKASSNHGPTLPVLGRSKFN